MKVLATGATGKYASAVVRALAARGVEVRAMVHDRSRASIASEAGATETVEADLADPASLRAAVDGVDGVFLITPAFHPDATRMGRNVVEACIAASVSKIVYNGVYHPSLSLINHACTRPVEEALYSSELDFTVLQPAMYVQALGRDLSTGTQDRGGRGAMVEALEDELRRLPRRRRCGRVGADRSRRPAVPRHV